jgi:hypothetical protein
VVSPYSKRRGRRSGAAMQKEAEGQETSLRAFPSGLVRAPHSSPSKRWLIGFAVAAAPGEFSMLFRVQNYLE